MKQRTLSEIGCLLDLPERLPEVVFRKGETDSKNVGQGDLFFALTGAKTDGHNYLADVASKGAVCAVVSKRYDGPDYGMVLIKVDEVLPALQKIAKKRIASWAPPIVAVTGSVGKTTTKEFIATLLSSRFAVGKSPGNANSQVGLAIAVLNFTGDEEVLVLEMGMTEAGNIANLIQIAPPTVAVITKIGMAHAGNFSNGIEGVAGAKAEILAHPKTELAIIGLDAWRFEAVRNTGSCKKRTAGFGPGQGDFTLLQEGDAFFALQEQNGVSPRLTLPFTMSHFLEDFSLAAAVGRSMGLWWEEMIPVLPFLQSTGNRFAKISIDGALFINDAYNAGPESVKAALDNLPIPGQKGRKIAVLGGMTVDMGPLSDSIHREVARHALNNADHFFCYGPGAVPMKEVFEEAGRLCLFTEDMDELRNRVFSFVQPQDVVLVKGANRYAMWALFEEPIPKHHGSEKSMFFDHIERPGEARPIRDDGRLPKGAGEELGTRYDQKGRFCAPKSLEIGSKGKIS